MRAWVLEAFGGPEVLQLREVPDPEPGAGEVRVAVRSIAVARTKDVAARAGLPPFGPRLRLPHVLGAEHAGVVESVGAGVDPALVGTRVGVSAVLSCGECTACRRGREEACRDFGLVGVDRPGCYAELVVVPAGNVHAIPDDLSTAQAAALAANGPVARAQLDAGDVGPGSTVAVMGAAGALGSAAAVLARQRGATVVAVEQLAAKGPFLQALGVHAALDGDDPDLAEKLLAETGGWGLDCVVDNLGLAGLFAAYRPAVADMGRIVVSGAISADPVSVELRPFYLRSQSLVGVRTGNRRQIQALWDDVRLGVRLPDAAVVSRPWTDVRDVHALVKQGRSLGQTVLEVS